MAETRNGKSAVREVDNWNRLGQEGKILATRVGLRFPAKLDYRDWERAGEQLARIADSSIWCLGDWLAFGQVEYSDRYQRAIELAGLDYQTLRNYAWVARKFDWPRRRSKLSFQHHAEVAALPEDEQDKWLELAETHGWSRNQLRRQIREDGSRQGMAGSPDMPELSRMRVPVDHFARWREAADRAGIRFERWVIAALDDAAGEVLEDLRD
jgi:hypothetical protein